MKWIARIAAILAAAAVVIAITYGLSQTSFVQNAIPSGPDRSAMVQNTTTTSDASTTSGTTDASTTTASTTDSPPAELRDHEGGEGFSIFGALEVLKNLVIVAVITALVSLVKRFLPKRGPKNGGKGPRRQTAPAPSL